MEQKQKELWLRQSAVILTFIMGFLWLVFGIIKASEVNDGDLVIGSILPGAVIILLGLLAIRWTVVGAFSPSLPWCRSSW
ncbi:MAG: hypothetical protein GXP63_07660 [DPANN group archaeon]|nr:hypothetical protein [DPANN group archaeon]